MALNGNGLALHVPDELVDAIAQRVAALMPAPATSEPDPWLDVEGAASYLSAPVSRIYDLKAQGRLRWDKDGSRLIFRRSWLDQALKHHGEGSA